MPTLTSTEPTWIAICTVNEGNVMQIAGVLVDQDDTPVPLAAIGTMTLTLYDWATDTVINSRLDQSVLNVNGGTLHPTSGAFTLRLGGADNPILTPAGLAPGQTETHVALLEATWSSGGAWAGQIKVLVRQIHRRP